MCYRLRPNCLGRICTRTSLNVREGGVFGIVGMRLVLELYVGHKHYGDERGEWHACAFLAWPCVYKGGGSNVNTIH